MIQENITKNNGATWEQKTGEYIELLRHNFHNNKNSQRD
jgi:hypothetical protein